MIAHTGLRRDEALNLQLADIDLTASVLRVEARCRWKFGMSPEMLMRILRHTSPRTQEIYVHDPEVRDLVESVRAVSYQRAKKEPPQ
jgi:integrase